jgi:small subunit ribosomal protein S17
MSEDEKKDVTEETPQDEGAQDAGPVAEEGGSEAALGSSPDAQEGEAEESEGRGTDAASASDPPSPTPPASEEPSEEEAPAVEADAPAKEKAEEPEAAAEEPAAEAEESEPDPEDELPWKEKRRLERSREPHTAKPQQSPEERLAARAEARKAKAAERRKERAAAKAKHQAGAGTPPAERDAVAAKVRQGIVVSDKGQKSITVRVDIVRRHPTYEKVIRRSRTLHAHDERNEAGEGDVVRVVETRPLSKTKRWRLVEVLEKAK